MSLQPDASERTFTRALVVDDHPLFCDALMITRRRFLAVSACALGVSAFRTAPIIWHGQGLGAEISLRLHTNEALAQEAIRKTQRILHKIEETLVSTIQGPQ